MLTPADIADRLVTARESRTAIDPFSDEDPELDLTIGYAAQETQRQQAGPLAGWKLGVTSRAKQVQVGVHEPTRGFLSANLALDLGEPLPIAEHINPRAEPEIVFIMGADLVGANVTATQVLQATSGVAAGIEIIDSRYRNYRFTPPDVVADNSSAGRFVVGPITPLEAIDLRSVGVVLEHNGDVTATASGAASLGNPASAVAWLVRSLAAAGEGLHAGDVVLSGGLTAAVPVRAGDCVVATIDRLGSVELACM